jgi:hypothetical protein
MLSKFMTANRREAIAAPEMRARVTIRSKDAVFLTVAGERSEGSGYATGMILEALRRPQSRGSMKY